MCSNVLSVYVFHAHYLHIPREAGPFVAPQTGTVEQFLSAKNGTSYHFWLPNLVLLGPLLAKMETYGIFQALKLIYSWPDLMSIFGNQFF